MGRALGALGQLGCPCSRWQWVEDVPEDRQGASQSEDGVRAAGVSAYQGPPPRLCHTHTAEAGAPVGSPLWQRHDEKREANHVECCAWEAAGP